QIFQAREMSSRAHSNVTHLRNDRSRGGHDDLPGSWTIRATRWRGYKAQVMVPLPEVSAAALFAKVTSSHGCTVEPVSTRRPYFPLPSIRTSDRETFEL